MAAGALGASGILRQARWSNQLAQRAPVLRRLVQSKRWVFSCEVAHFSLVDACVVRSSDTLPISCGGGWVVEAG
jgi:hypothetical protein